MITQKTALVTALALLLGAVPLALGQQQGGGSDMSNMPGMKGGKSGAPSHDMKGTDMDSMMKQCAQMRQQMKPGAAMSADMKKMMAECDEMDRSMNAPSQQPYTPPADRRR